MSKYDDIIDLPHHVSASRRRMTLENRAAQFAPFAALTGYEGAIAETARITSPRAALSADECAELSWRMAYLLSRIAEQPPLVVTHFVADRLKAGGRYEEFSGRLRKFDPAYRQLIFADGTRLHLDNIISLRSPLLDS